MTRQQWKQGIRRTAMGALIGIGAVAPGISGGAIAVAFGLYPKVTGAITSLWRTPKASLSLLLPLGLGGGISALFCGRLIEYGFRTVPVAICTLFIGLMLGTLPSLVQDALRQKYRWWYPFLTLAALGVTILSVKQFTFTHRSATLTFPLLLLCGVIVGIGTVVPGVSTSFSLMALGLYEPVLCAVNRMDIPTLFPMVLGFSATVLTGVALIDKLYRTAGGAMRFLVIGLLLGSVVQVFPATLFQWRAWGYWGAMLCAALSSYIPLRYLLPNE